MKNRRRVRLSCYFRYSRQRLIADEEIVETATAQEVRELDRPLIDLHHRAAFRSNVTHTDISADRAGDCQVHLKFTAVRIGDFAR